MRPNVGIMRTMTLTDMLRYGGVIIQVIATMSCLAADSKTPVTDPSSKVITTNLHQQTGLVLLESKRVMVSVETAHRTCIIRPYVLVEAWVIRDSPPPWKDGHHLDLRFPKVGGLVTVPEEWEEWSVPNMHAENFFEAASRLKLSSIEVHLLRINDLGLGHPESLAGYAVVTDARIPRDWYRWWPGKRGDPKTARELKEAYPEIFGP
jgi:hypothetical protein